MNQITIDLDKFRKELKEYYDDGEDMDPTLIVGCAFGCSKKREK